jgi:hypothetical protein
VRASRTMQAAERRRSPPVQHAAGLAPGALQHAMFAAQNRGSPAREAASARLAYFPITFFAALRPLKLGMRASPPPAWSATCWLAPLLDCMRLNTRPCVLT